MTRPPSGVNFIALSSRLSRSRSSQPASPRAATAGGGSQRSSNRPGVCDRFELLDERGRQRAEIDDGERQRDLTGLGARQREHLVDEPCEAIDVLDLAGEGALQLRRRVWPASASSISPRNAASGVRSSWASAELNCRISPIDCSSRARVSLNARVTSSSSSSTPRGGRRRSSVATSMSRAASARRVRGARAKPESHHAPRSGTEQRQRCEQEQQVTVAAERRVEGHQRDAYLEQVTLPARADDRTVDQTQAAVRAC